VVPTTPVRELMNHGVAYVRERRPIGPVARAKIGRSICEEQELIIVAACVLASLLTIVLALDCAFVAALLNAGPQFRVGDYLEILARKVGLLLDHLLDVLLASAAESAALRLLATLVNFETPGGVGVSHRIVAYIGIEV